VTRSLVGVINDGSMFITDSSFTANIDGALSSGYGSGGLDISVVIRNSRFSGNIGTAAALQLGETATISNSIISNNTNTWPRGLAGSIHVGSEGTVTIRDSTITGNTSQTAGGGVVVDPDASLALVRSVVSGNHVPTAPEINVRPGGVVVSDNNNVIGQQGSSGVAGFIPSPSNTVPSTPVAAVVNQETGTPAPNSLVIDGVTDGTCTDPKAVDGNGDGGVVCDIGAVEVPAPPGPPTASVPKPPGPSGPTGPPAPSEQGGPRAPPPPPPPPPPQDELPPPPVEEPPPITAPEPPPPPPPPDEPPPSVDQPPPLY
jgi:hypothetical protein